MKKLKKVIIVIIMFFIALLFSNSSYAVTQERAGEGLANFAKNFYNMYQSYTKYSVEGRETTYTGITVDGQYKFDCVGWISFAIHQCLGIGEDEFTYFAVPPGVYNNVRNDAGYFNGFELIKGKIDENTSLTRNEVENTVKPGDILFCSPKGPHVVLYVGDGKIVHCGGNNLTYESLYDNSMQYTGYCAIGRITKVKAEAIQEGNITEIFDGDYLDEYGRYYGTTEGRYVGSYNVVSWLFNQFVGFMDYLFGIIAYILRAPFVGWANIIENMINDTIVNIQGVEVKDTDDGMEVTNDIETIEDGDTSSVYKPVANDKLQNTVATSNRINIEDLIYNNIPILDVDFFDVNLDKFVGAKKIDADKAASSPVVLLRKNVAIWYYSIRNVSIVIMLLVLVVLGIKLALSNIGEKQANYKELLKAWLIGFIVIFFIHFFMIIVIDVNNILVDTFHEALDDQLQGSASLYDTVRTRAYSFKLSEGVPATIIYMVLIYFLIKFLFIYVKRYFTVNILALMGPIMGAKYAYDKVTKGKTSSLSNWMFDFAMNVLLQTVHAMLYSVFMVMAFEVSTTSIPGFVLALVMLNFIFKAEELFLKIFKFDDRSSSIRDVRENKNYFLEAYKVTTGVAYFAGAVPKFGFGAVKNTTKYAGLTAGLAGQLVTSGVNTIDWAVKNRNTDIKDLAKGKGVPYKHGDFVGTVKGIADKVGAGVTGKLDDALYATTGKRSLKLGLGRMKLEDKERYTATKALLAKNKKLKKEVLKRNIGGGIKSVTTMAKLMGSIPMMVVDPGSGFTMFTTTVGDLKDMASGDPHYGHMSRKQIRGRRGRVAATLLLGTPVVAVNGAGKSFKQLKKDRKDIRKNKQILDNLREAQVLQSKIKKQTSLISAQRQLELEALPEEERDSAKKQYEKALKDTINKALVSVLTGKNIEGAIKDYMKRNRVNRLQSSDIEKLLKEFNLENIDKQIEKLTVIEQREIDKLQEKVNNLKAQIENAAESVNLSDEAIKAIKAEINADEVEIGKHTSQRDAIKEINKKISISQDLDKYMIHTDSVEKIVKDYMEKEKVETLSQEDVDKIVSIFETQISEQKNIYASKDGITKKFEESEKEKLDRKESVGAILDSILEEGDKGVKEDIKEKRESKEYDKISDNMFTQLETMSDMVRELETLDQKNKVVFGNSKIHAKQFAKQIKFGEQKNKKEK